MNPGHAENAVRFGFLTFLNMALYLRFDDKGDKLMTVVTWFFGIACMYLCAYFVRKGIEHRPPSR